MAKDLLLHCMFWKQTWNTKRKVPFKKEWGKGGKDRWAGGGRGVN